MTFAIGRRFIIVDGVERWKDKELDALAGRVGADAPDTTIAFFAREDGRAEGSQAPARRGQQGGRRHRRRDSVKPWELPKWAVAQARQLGLELTPDAARMLVAHVGERQQRLLRELEKLALGVGAGPATSRRRLDAELVDELTAPPPSARRGRWPTRCSRATPAATRTLLQLRAQGERLPGLSTG